MAVAQRFDFPSAGSFSHDPEPISPFRRSPPMIRRIIDISMPIENEVISDPRQHAVDDRGEALFPHHHE